VARIGGPGSGGWEAERLALAGPVNRQVLEANKLVGCQLNWLPPLQNRLDDIRGQIGDSKHRCEVGGVDAVRGSDV